MQIFINLAHVYILYQNKLLNLTLTYYQGQRGNQCKKQQFYKLGYDMVSKPLQLY